MLPMDLFAYLELWVQYFINMGLCHDALINILHGIMGVVRAEDGSWVAAAFYG